MKFNVDSVELRLKMGVPNSYSEYLSLKMGILTKFQQNKRRVYVVHNRGAVSSAEVVPRTCVNYWHTRTSWVVRVCIICPAKSFLRV